MSNELMGEVVQTLPDKKLSTKGKGHFFCLDRVSKSNLSLGRKSFIILLE